MSLTKQHSHQLINQEVLKWNDYILFDQYYWYYLIKIDRRSRHQMSHSLMKPIAFCSTLEAAADYSSESQCVHSLSVKMKCFSVCVCVRLIQLMICSMSFQTNSLPYYLHVARSGWTLRPWCWRGRSLSPQCFSCVPTTTRSFTFINVYLFTLIYI